MTTEVVTTKEPTLEDLRANSVRLSGRRDALKREIAAAEKTESGFAEQLEQNKRALAAGDATAADAAKTARALREIQEVRQLRTEALQQVEAEHGAIDAEVRSRELAVERTRQEKVAAPLLLAAEACKREFIEAMVNVPAALERRKAILDRVERECQLVRRPDDPSLDELAVLYREMTRTAAGHHDLVATVRRALLGTDSWWMEHHTKRFGVSGR